MAKYVYYGGDYNPEQWPRATWEEDVALMLEAGVNLVTVGVFSWAQLEPREGVFTFGWLRDLLDLLGTAGIGVDLATPTAAPPAWLSTAYPDVLPVDERGASYSHGSRQAICMCSTHFLERASAIVSALAGELGAHEAVKMWHVHNEYACHVPYCYCDNHAAGFRYWLEKRYGSVDGLNDAWGTAFWSQTYSDLDQVVPPRMTAAFINPGLDLDYKRFSTEVFLEEFLMEKAILKAARPDLPVTTNFLGFFRPTDCFQWAGHMDMVSTDSYPDSGRPGWPVHSAMQFDLTRGLNKSSPWMVMEQTSFRVNWQNPNVPKRPGQMRAMSYQALARGAEGLMFFQWRASRAGAEKFHSAMVPHAGKASPVWAEVAALGQELSRLEDMSGTYVNADVALLFSWPNWWAVEAPSQPAGKFSLMDQLLWFYRPLYERGVTVDFCEPGEALGGYKAVIVPSVYLMSEQQGSNMRSYVERGGTGIISYWSGIVDERDSVYLGPYGGPLRPLFGCDVLDVAPLPLDESVGIRWEQGDQGTADFWTDLLGEGSGDVLAHYASGPLSGRPAVVRTNYGRGQAYYIGCRLDAPTLGLLYDLVPELRPPGETKSLGDQVEHVVRTGPDRRYEFLINHSDLHREVELPDGGTDLLSGKPAGPRVTLGPAGVCIVRYSRAAQEGL